MSQVIDELRSRIDERHIYFDGENSITIITTDPSDGEALKLFISCGKCEEEESDLYSYWFDEDGDMQCGERFVDQVAEFVKGIESGEITGSWDDFLENILQTT